MQAKNIIIATLVLALIIGVGFLFFKNGSDTIVVVNDAPSTTTEEVLPVEPDNGIGDTQNVQKAEDQRGAESVLGYSEGGEEIVAYHFGSGTREILLIGGVHGGYSPNTADLADEFVAYFKKDNTVIPSNLMVTVIPNLNPDGSEKTGTAGRFNNNNVDINRNFDCDWSATALWRSEKVSGGTAAFSEQEAAALRDYVVKYDPAIAIVWFSAEGKVYSSACDSTPSKASTELASTFATAAGYPAEAVFDAYPVTGDMVNWMAKQGIPAISVLLTNYQNTEWTKNEAGIKAVLAKYAE